MFTSICVNIIILININLTLAFLFVIDGSIVLLLFFLLAIPLIITSIVRVLIVSDISSFY